MCNYLVTPWKIKRFVLALDKICRAFVRKETEVNECDANYEIRARSNHWCSWVDDRWGTASGSYSGNNNNE